MHPPGGALRPRKANTPRKANNEPGSPASWFRRVLRAGSGPPPIPAKEPSHTPRWRSLQSRRTAVQRSLQRYLTIKVRIRTGCLRAAAVSVQKLIRPLECVGNWTHFKTSELKGTKSPLRRARAENIVGETAFANLPQIARSQPWAGWCEVSRVKTALS